MAIVFRFRAWDSRSDCYQESRRWATKERIAKLGGESFGDGVEVDESRLGQVTAGEQVEGMLAHNESPYPPSPHRMR